MKLTISIEYCDLEYCQDMSFYNTLIYKIKQPHSGFEYLIEKYDDVHETPDYFLCKNPDKHSERLYGYGEPIDQDKLRFSGKWLDITVENNNWKVSYEKP